MVAQNQSKTQLERYSIKTEDENFGSSSMGDCSQEIRNINQEKLSPSKESTLRAIPDEF